VELPVLIGYVLNKDDMIRRETIRGIVSELCGY
jgi:hypothetical protein